MSICTNQYAIQTIDLDECIGVSLNTINSNFKLLKDENCLTFTELELLSASINSINLKCTDLSGSKFQLAQASAAFDGTGTATPSVYSSFNVASILRRSTGVFELSFATAFPNISYALIGTCSQTQTSTNNLAWVQPLTTLTTTSATINITDLSGIRVNPQYISVVVFSK